MAGPIFETAVLLEILKSHYKRGLMPRIHFWRTSTGREVDFVLDLNLRLTPVEAKLNMTPNPRMAEGITVFRKDYHGQVDQGYVIHPGEAETEVAEGVRVVGFDAM